MSTSAPFVVIAVCSFGAFAACGGRASSPDLGVVPCESGVGCTGELPVPELPEAPRAMLPEAVTILELREIADASDPSQVTVCDSQAYDRRIKVNLRERLLMMTWCSPHESGVFVRNGGNVALTDADVGLIEGAYANLQLSGAEQCASGPGVMTLDVSIDARPEPELLLADEEDSGCALPGLEQREFVSGLDELRSVLLSLVRS